MCTVLFMRTFSGFKGYRDINPSDFLPILTYRGRDKYRVVIFDGKPTPTDVECESPVEVLDVCRTVKGQSLIAIFGRATPETEEDVTNELKQPMIFEKDGTTYIALHHGIYSNAKPDEYDSLALVEYYKNHNVEEFENELLYNSSFVFMLAEANHYCKSIDVYVGTLPFSFEQRKEYVLLGTINNSYTPEFAYTKLKFLLKNREVRIDSLKPLGKAKSLYPLIQYDRASFHLYKDCNVASLYSGGLDSLIATSMFLDKYKLHQCEVHKLDLIFFDYGQAARLHEDRYVHKAVDYFKTKYNIPAVNVIKLPLPIPTSNLTTNINNRDNVQKEAESDSNYVPMRNLLMISFAAKLCEERNNQILLCGFNLTEGMTYCDNSPLFYYNISNALMAAGKRGYYLTFIAPTLHMTKTDMIVYALKNGIDIDEYSFSCYYPTADGKPCNKCGSCLLRNKAKERAQKLVEQKKVIDEDNIAKEFQEVSLEHGALDTNIVKKLLKDKSKAKKIKRKKK